MNAWEEFAFWAMGTIMVASALGMVLARKAVHCALFLATIMITLAMMYAAQGAPFLFAVQIIVYTGAIMMLFLFVLMLVGVDSSDSLVETLKGQRFWAIVAGLGFLVLIILAIGNAVFSDQAGLAQATAQGGYIRSIALLLFTKYVFAFEITSALLITAALGAMVLAHRERLAEKPTQKDLSRARFLGDHPSPLPGPGTYARNNAIDMPARLPDGSVAESSVNRYIARYDVEHGHLPEDPELAEAIRHTAEEDSEESTNEVTK